MRECRVIVPATGDACKKQAFMKVTFTDDDVVVACKNCASFLEARAVSYGTSVKVEKLEE